MAVAELRHRGTLPQLPAELRLLAADISDEAREIHRAMLGRLSPTLAAVGIRVLGAYRSWDVTDDFSTAELMTAWLEHAPKAEVYFVLVSAFSGFAAKGQNSDVVLGAFRDIALRLHDRLFLMAWIEPMMNQSQKFLPKLLGKIMGLFRSRPLTTASDMSEVFQYKHPFTSEAIRGQAKVVHFQKVRT